ncbi:MATE family efflux transporter [Agathobacter sp.]
MSHETNSAPVTENKMGTMPIGKLVFNMSLPMMISMLVQALYNIVDSIFVAKLSENALTAVSLAFPLQTLLIAVATGTGVGMNALLSKSLGAHKYEEANKIAVNAALLYFLSYIVFLILGFTIVRPFYMSQIGNADVEIMDMGIEYLSTVMIFSFGLLAQIYFERLLTSTGRTIFSMTSQLCGAITNIILDPIMIFGLLGFPKMGVTGAAVATVVGQCVAAIVAFTCNHKFNHEIKVHFKGFRPDIRIIGTIYAIGIPSIIMQSIGSVMTYSMNRILIGFSATATAVFGVYFKLQSFFFMPVFGLNNGITPIIAFNYGAQNRKRMIKTIKVSLATAFCLTFLGFICFEGIPQVLLGMFNASDDMLKIGVPALRIIGVHYLMAWFSIICSTIFQALGKAVFSMIVSIMRQLFILIPAAYILAKIGGLAVVWWSFPIAEVISVTVSVLFLIYIYRKIISKIPAGSDVL